MDDLTAWAVSLGSNHGVQLEPLMRVLSEGRLWLLLAAIAAFVWISWPASWTLLGVHRARREAFVRALSNEATLRYLTRWAPEPTTHGLSSQAALRVHVRRAVPWRWSPAFTFCLLTGSALAWLLAYALRRSGPVELAAPWLRLTSATASALAGALVWVAFEQRARLRTGDFSLDHVVAHSLRIAVMVPLSGILTLLAAPEIVSPLAFMIGAFPAASITRLARRAADRRWRLGDVGRRRGPHLVLERLQGVSRPVAERFAEQGVRSLLQLIYTDPYVLVMRTGFDFDLVKDLVSQAFLWMYATDDGLPKLQRVGLRGAIELVGLGARLRSHDMHERLAAHQLVADAAETLGTSREAVEHIIAELSADPYAQMICGFSDDERVRLQPSFPPVSLRVPAVSKLGA